MGSSSLARARAALPFSWRGPSRRRTQARAQTTSRLAVAWACALALGSCIPAAGAEPPVGAAPAAGTGASAAAGSPVVLVPAPATVSAEPPGAPPPPALDARLDGMQALLPGIAPACRGKELDLGALLAAEGCTTELADPALASVEGLILTVEAPERVRSGGRVAARVALANEHARVFVVDWLAGSCREGVLDAQLFDAEGERVDRVEDDAVATLCSGSIQRLAIEPGGRFVLEQALLASSVPHAMVRTGETIVSPTGLPGEVVTDVAGAPRPLPPGRYELRLALPLPDGRAPRPFLRRPLEVLPR